MGAPKGVVRPRRPEPAVGAWSARIDPSAIHAGRTLPRIIRTHTTGPCPSKGAG
jgi:hypothetical protein